MKKRQLVVFGVFTLIVVLIAAAVISGNDKGGNMGGMGRNKEKPKYVKVSDVELDTVQMKVAAFGRVTSSRNVNLTAEVQGKLREGSVPLKPGQHFRKGQFLFGVDDAEQQLSLQSRKSQFLNLMASVLPDLRIDYKDNFKQWENFFRELEVTKPMPELPATASVNEKTFLASRNVLSEYYGIKADEERLKKYNVYAPFDGGYTEVMVEVGTVVNPGTQIARIIQYNSLEVKIPVTVEEMQLIEKGASAEIFSGDRKFQWSGRVSRISSHINQATQSVDIFIDISDDRENALYEGMYVKAIVNCGEVTDAIEISRKAVFENNFVYVVEDSLLTRKQISVQKTNDKTVIVKGLSEGEQLVTEPLIGVKESSKVVPIKG